MPESEIFMVFGSGQLVSVYMFPQFKALCNVVSSQPVPSFNNCRAGVCVTVYLPFLELQNLL